MAPLSHVVVVKLDSGGVTADAGGGVTTTGGEVTTVGGVFTVRVAEMQAANVIDATADIKTNIKLDNLIILLLQYIWIT
jgi:ribosomal protein S8E